MPVSGAGLADDIYNALDYACWQEGKMHNNCLTVPAGHEPAPS